MTNYSCIDHKREDFDATRFCQLFSEALFADLCKEVSPATLLGELKKDINDLKLDDSRFELPGHRYIELDASCRAPLSIAMLAFVPFIEAVTERYGVNVSFDSEEDIVRYPRILKLKGEAASDLMSLCVVVESENRIIGGLLPFTVMLERAESVSKIEKQRILNQSQTGRHLVAVSDDS